MNILSRLRSGSWRSYLIALILSVVLIVVEQFSQGQVWSRKAFDWLTILTAREQPDLPIVIVGIDEASFAELDLQWPWPRGIHGYLVQQLQAAGAAVIAFDVLFAEPSSEEEDQLFAQAIQEAPNVVLAADMSFQETEHAYLQMPVEPIPLLTQAGAHVGFAGIHTDGDQIVRKIPSEENKNSFWQIVLGLYLATQAPMQELPEVPAESLVRYVNPGTFTYVSYYQALLASELLPDGFFKDKIVLIGLNLKTSPLIGRQDDDKHATPFFIIEKQFTPGVEIHANFINSVAAENWLSPLPNHYHYALLVLILLLATWSMQRWNPYICALYGVGFAVLIMLISLLPFEYYNIWWPILASIAGIIVIYINQGGMAYLSERKRRQAIRQAFSYYVDPEVVKEMIAHPEKLVLGGQRRELTLMFTDLAGFTTLSEKLDAEQVAQILNEHLTAMTTIIKRHGGLVDKFIGDAIMAFWGAPLDDPEQALKACQAAQEMRQEMIKMRADLAQRQLPPLHMRIGIHSGIAVAGNMGAKNIFNYTAIGDTVNLASRLEGTNKLYGTEILLSGATAEQLKDRLPLRPIDKVKVAGKSQAVEIFTLSEDTSLNAQYETAINAYRAQDWQQAQKLWSELREQNPEAKVAAVYLQRISEFQNQTPPPDWDGSVALEKM